MEVKLLIDGDVLAYRAGFATEKTKYLTTQGTVINNGPATFVEYHDDARAAKEWTSEREGSLVWSRKEAEPVDKALMIVDVMIGDIRARYDQSSISVFLTGIGNYRNSIATRATYKGNRAGSVPPKHLSAIRDHLSAKWGALLSAGEEADDLIGIASTASPDAIVCSIDKDLLQLPGKHYNFVTKEEQTVSPKQAVLNFYQQVLSGDPVDNVPGIDGIGPVKARKVLEGAKNPRECWMRTLDAYLTAYGPIGRFHAFEAANLVFVRREVAINWRAPESEATPAAPQRVEKASRS